MPDIHITDVQTFLTCRKRWDYSSLLRQGLEPRRLVGPFVTGRAIHAALEAFYKHGTDAVETVQAFFEHTRQELIANGRWERSSVAFAEELELSLSMADYYMFWHRTYDGPWKDDDLEIISMETEFNVPIRRAGGRQDIALAGRFDGIVKHKADGSYWLMETKTAANQFDRYDETLDRSIQATAYVIAAEHVLKQPVAGVMYNILRKKIISPPPVLKSGMLSQNKSMDVPVHYYLAYIRKHHSEDFDRMFGEHPAEQRRELTNDWIQQNYGDTIAAMNMRPREFVKRAIVRKTAEEKKTFLREFWAIANDMANAQTPIYRNEGAFTCGFCPFSQMCSIEKNGGDIQYIVANDFQPRTREVHLALEVE